MALNWNLSEIENHKRLFETRVQHGKEGRYLKPFAESIILATIPVGMGEITKDNWLEFYKRMRIIETVNDFGWFGWKSVRGKHKSINVEKKHVKRMIGLKTNVSNESPAKWFRRYKDVLTQKADE